MPFFSPYFIGFEKLANSQKIQKKGLYIFYISNFIYPIYYIDISPINIQNR